MYWLGGLLVSGLIMTTTALAQDVKLNTKYQIYGDYTTVTTNAGTTNKYDGQMSGYLFPHLRGALQGMAYVTSVIQTKGVESSETNTWWDYELKKRKSHAFLKLALQSPLTLLFEIEENYRKCIAKDPKAAAAVSHEDSGSASSSCQLQSVITVKGPIAVYGNFASSINVDALMRNKQEVEITLGKTYSSTSEMTSRFNIKSVSFDDSLARFFRVFNIPVFVGHGGDVGYGNNLLDKVSPLTSRQRLMLGISRVMRAANERIMN